MLLLHCPQQCWQHRLTSCQRNSILLSGLGPCFHCLAYQTAGRLCCLCTAQVNAQSAWQPAVATRCTARLQPSLLSGIISRTCLYTLLIHACFAALKLRMSLTVLEQAAIACTQQGPCLAAHCRSTTHNTNCQHLCSIQAMLAQSTIL